MNLFLSLVLIVAAFLIGWFTSYWAFKRSLDRLTKLSGDLDESTDSLAESISRNKQAKR